MYPLKNVEIEINHHCNMACSYCPNAVAERIEKGHMRPELYLQLITQLQEMDFKGTLSFNFYNEPLLSSSLEEFVGLAKNKLPHAKVEIYTNGTLLDENRFFALINAGVDLFIVTRHQDTKKFPFDRILEKTQSKSIKEKIAYQTYEDLTLTNRGGVLTHIPNKVPALTPCQLPMFMAIITLEGNVLPCFEDFYQKNTMGNIREKSLREIWNSSKFESFRKDLNRGLRHKYEACKDCSRLQALTP